MGLFAKIRNGLKKTKDAFITKLNAVFRGGDINAEFYEDLEFALINSDIGAVTTQEIISRLKDVLREIIDDEAGTTLVSSSSVELKIKNGGNIEGATLVGQDIAKKAKAKKIKKIVFDRGGYLYHGRVKALAEAARENGLEF